MKTIRAEFHNGHLWNPDTGQRIVFRDKSEVIITVTGDKSLHEIAPSNEPAKVIQSELEQECEMEARSILAQDKGKYFDYRKIMNRGESLYFTINAGIRDKEKLKSMKAYFTVMLLEDLYIARTKASDKEGRVEPCACVVNKESGYGLPFFEPVHAYSLNDAYSKTYVLYFNIFGKATTNVYSSFYVQPNADQRFILNHLRTFPEK